MISPSQPIKPGAEDKLAALRRLDKSRAWNSLDDQLYCTIFKSVISGRQIEVVGGNNGLRPLRLKCSTPGCFSTPADWILPVKSETVREIVPKTGQMMPPETTLERLARRFRLAPRWCEIRQAVFGWTTQK